MHVHATTRSPQTLSFSSPRPATSGQAEEKQELDQWVKRYQPELGLLQSPPIGPAGPKAREAQRYVGDLVRDLAGSRLKEQGIELRVEIFSGDVAQVGLDDSVEQETAWEKNNPDKPWPIRTWLEAPKEGSKPLYRLALSQGLLETLKTRDELGFVVAHQLQSLLKHHAEDPENESELAVGQQSWLKSRQFQLQNDAAALDMMSQAKINPKGALGALEKLYKKFGPSYPADDQRAALTAAAEIQEHEGIRFSALQLQVENLRRTGHPSTAQESLEIPAEVVAKATGDYQTSLDNFPAFQAAMSQAGTALAGDETPAWMFGERSDNPAVNLLKTLQPNPEEFERALLGVCEHLSQTSPSPQHRVNGLLRLALALDGECLPKEFSPSGQEKLREFLSTNSTWSADKFLNSLQKDGQSLHREFVTDISLNETFQSVLAPIYKSSAPSELKKLVDRAPENFCHNPQSNGFEIQALPMFLDLNNGEKHQERALAGAHNSASLKLLASQDPSKLAQEIDPSGLSRGLLLGNDMRRVDNLEPDFAIDLQDTMKPIQEAANALREDRASLRLRPPLAEPSKLGYYLQEFFASEAGGAFSSEFEDKLPSLLMDVVRSCNHQPDIVFDTGRPRELEPGLQRRLVETMKTAPGQEKGEVLRFLSRSWPHELRLPTHSERRAWTQEMAAQLSALEPQDLLRQLSTPDTAQHSQFLQKTLVEGYGLSPEALPDASTPSLMALEKRVSAGEFKPKRENFQDPAEYEKARDAYQARVESMQEVTSFLAPVEARLNLSKLAILGHQPELSLEVASRLSGDDFLSILKNTEETVERSKLLRKVTSDNAFEIVGTDAGSFLIDGFLSVEKSFPEIDTFYDLAKRTVEISPLATEARSDTRGRLADALNSRLEKLEKSELKEWLGKERVLSTLKPEQTSNLLFSLIDDLAKPGASPEALGSAMRDLEKSFELKEKHGLAYVLLRDQVTETAKLQPKTLDTVFPPEEKNPIEHLRQFRPQLAGLSGLIAMTRNHPPKVQLAAVEYIMGRSDEMPDFLEKASENQSLGPVAQTVRNARQSLSEADIALRVVVANSFLAGPHGLLKAEGGKEAVFDHFLAGVRPEALKLARPITQALLASQGDADSLAVAVVLGQKPKKDGATKLTEADILSRVFDSYGVPGTKMKQYLAFTSQFEAYREAFEDAQDAANPLNYFETLRLIQNRFGSEWPEGLEVDRVLGSGSVNVAIRYHNQNNGQREVVSLGRQDIEEQTKYDFDRFQKFVDVLTSTEEGAASFGFIKGLTGIIADSVELEFDKENAKAVQKQAYETYRHKFDDGWTVKSIDAYSVKNLGLFMQEAKGKTARKVLTSKPELYKLAVGHVAKAEFNLLKGRDATNNLIPRPNFANPDIHDGQILIDEESKTATVLDFGQAVPLSNKDRQLGLDLLTVLGKLSTAKGAAKRINKKFFPDAKKGEGVTKEDIRAVWKSPKKMDMFIRLLALVSEKGGKVPLSTVHWVLALNRQFVLGEKVEQSVKAQVVGMVVNHRLGLGLGAFNTVQAATEKVSQWTSSLVSGIGGWVSGWFQSEPSQTTEQAKPSSVESPIKLHGFKGFNPALINGPKAEEKKVEKAWRDPGSFAFYLDDFGPAGDDKS